MIIIANRTRKNGIYLMLSDDELDILNEKLRLSECKSLRQFIMKCVLEKDIFVLDMDIFREMSVNIARTTGSINQIAKRVNSTSVIYKDDIADIKDMIKKQGREIYDMRKKIYSLGNEHSTNTEKI